MFNDVIFVAGIFLIASASSFDETLAQDDVKSVTRNADAHWPSFRGPGAKGMTHGPATKTSWNLETGENILWKTKVPGLGHSSPVIWGNRIYITTATGSQDDTLRVGIYGDGDSVEGDGEQSYRVLAFDRNDGSLVWERVAHTGIPAVKRHPKSTHASSTPATDGNTVVAYFGSEGLYAYSKDGELLWSKQFGLLDTGAPGMRKYQWGVAASPIIHENVVLLQCDIQDDSFLVALDIADGEELWRTERDEDPTWSTPNVARTKYGQQVLCNGYKHIGGYDFETGEEIWKLVGGGDVPVPTPLPHGDLFIITNAHGRQNPVYAIKNTASGLIQADKGEGHMAWFNLRRGIYMQTPIVVGDELYCCGDNGVLGCYDVNDGKEHYRTRLTDAATGFSASAVASHGRIYLSGEYGDVFVINANASSLDLVSQNSVGEVCMATPAIADGHLYFRTQGHLIAIGE